MHALEQRPHRKIDGYWLDGRNRVSNNRSRQQLLQVNTFSVISNHEAVLALATTGTCTSPYFQNQGINGLL